jgi:hypothetical protein
MNILIFNDDCKIFTEIIIILTLPFFLNIYIRPYLFNFYFNANLWNLAQWLYIYIQGQNIALLRQLEVGLPK